jgi:hypothetical protein
VSAGVVRNVLMRHPGVSWARVFARKAPLVGRMVGPEWCRTGRSADHRRRPGPVVLEPPPDYGVPRRIKFLDQIPQRKP